MHYAHYLSSQIRLIIREKQGQMTQIIHHMDERMNASSQVKVALYARVSLDETDKDSRRFQDPENQLISLREYAHAMNNSMGVYR